MSRFTIELAQESDDYAIRRIFQETPMDGKTDVTFQRQPSYFSAAKVGNKFYQIIVARDNNTNNIVGLGGRSIKTVYINGEIADIGYLSNLRIKKDYRGHLLMARIHPQYTKKLHQDKKVSIYLATIIQDNKYAIDLLTSERVGLPAYLDRGLYCTATIGLRRNKKYEVNSDIKVVRGSLRHLNGIVECLNRNGTHKQFYPYYAKENFLSNDGILKDFHIEDFYIALKNDRIIGVIGKWDQSNFKQVSITKYKGVTHWIRPIYNLGAKLLNLPQLPRSNSQLNFFYVSFIAVDSNDVEIFRVLFRSLYNGAIDSHYDYCLVGLHEKDGLLKALKEDYLCIIHNSRVFVVCWEDGRDSYNKLDDRIPYLELATL